MKQSEIFCDKNVNWHTNKLFCKNKLYKNKEII